jgi:excisionase family DNA binding protein
MSRQLFTTGEVARRCAVKPDTILKWIKKGRLRASRTLGGHFRVDERDLLPLLTKACPADETTPPKPSLLSHPLRCWEYMSEDLREECRNCVVYRVRATWCFRLATAMRNAGHAKRFCAGACQECPYHRHVHGQSTNVLVVTRDERLIQDLARRESGRITFRFARSAYDASAVVSVFRPAYAVVDENLLDNGEPGLLESLVSDPRSPGLRVLLGVRRGMGHTRSTKVSLAGTIEEPFTPEEIAALVARCPVEMVEAGDGE